MSCENQISTQDLINAKTDAVTLGEVATSRAGAESAGAQITQSTNRFGETTDTIQGRLNKLGVLYDDPIKDWSAGLLVSDLRAHRYPATTGDIYIPVKPLPFTTGGTFNTDDWALLNGYSDLQIATIIKNKKPVFSLPTLEGQPDSAVNITDQSIIFDGSTIDSQERTSGNGGGAIWDVVLASTVTINTYNVVQCVGIPSLALELRVKEPLDLAVLGAVADGVTNNSAELGIANEISSLATISASNGQYRFLAPLPALSDNFSLLISGNDAIVEPTDETLINGFKLDGGVANGYPYMPELSNKKIEVVCGTIRQEAPTSVVSITSVGTIATATKIAHGYANGEKVDIRGVDNSESLYNGYFVISNVTTDTFDYTLASTQTSPAPSASGITAHRPAVWNWIKDSAHEPVGVDDSQPVLAVGSAIQIPFSKTYSKVLSFVANADETLSNSIAFTCGSSVGLSSADIKASINITLAADIYWDGAAWATLASPGQGAGGFPVAIRDITYSGGTVSISHDWLGGSAVSVDMFGNGGATIPYLPIKRAATNKTTSFNFMDSFSTYYTGAESNKLSVSLVKTFTGGTFLDGQDGSSASLRLYNGNIWFMGVFEV